MVGRPTMCPARGAPAQGAPASGAPASRVPAHRHREGAVMKAQASVEPAVEGRRRWQRRFDEARLRDADFSTLSGLEVDPVYGPAPGAAPPGFERIGWPGEDPFTPGLYPAGSRGRAWTIRQFSGFGNARQTNERYKMLLRPGGAAPLR